MAGFVYLRSIITIYLPTVEIAKQWSAAVIMGALVYALQRAERTANLVNHNAITLLALVGTGVIVYFSILVGIFAPFRFTVRRNLPIAKLEFLW
jgi:hypothetical protein